MNPPHSDYLLWDLFGCKKIIEEHFVIYLGPQGFEIVDRFPELEEFEFQGSKRILPEFDGDLKGDLLV